MFCLINKKIIFLVNTLNWRPQFPMSTQSSGQFHYLCRFIMWSKKQCGSWSAGFFRSTLFSQKSNKYSVFIRSTTLIMFVSFFRSSRVDRQSNRTFEVVMTTAIFREKDILINAIVIYFNKLHVNSDYKTTISWLLSDYTTTISWLAVVWTNH